MPNATLSKALAVVWVVVKSGVIVFLIVAAMEMLNLWPGDFVRPAY